jgi:GNAT superfamily N-acetyltransferase
MEIFVRQMKVEDSKSVNQLSAQLGYPLSLEETRENIAHVLASENDDAYVALHNDKIVGWIGLSRAVLIEMVSYCEINGLVVDEKYRGLGVGKMLIEKAARWGKERGNDKLRLRCNVVRTKTHLFYQHLGFHEVKQQKVFEINI